MAGADEQGQRTVLDRVMRELQIMDMARTPPEIGDRVHRIVRAEVGLDDPYKEIKAHSTRQALALYPRLRRLVEAAEDRLACAVRLAIAGNMIDFAIADRPTEHKAMWAYVEEALGHPFAVDHVAALREALARAERVLYLGDNAGETVFDRVLIETMHVSTSYVVKERPVLNDATLEDAMAAGIGKVARIVSNGSGAPGTILSRCAKRFRQAFDGADVIIAKGQANYETLSECDAPLFFLLKVKCPIIARDIGTPVGSMLCKGGEDHARV